MSRAWRPEGYIHFTLNRHTSTLNSFITIKDLSGNVARGGLPKNPIPIIKLGLTLRESSRRDIRFDITEFGKFDFRHAPPVYMPIC